MTRAESQRKIVITGVGMVTPLGVGREASWSALLAGAGGLRLLPDRAELPADVLRRSPGLVAGGPLPDVRSALAKLAPAGNIEGISHVRDRTVLAALAAAFEAVADAAVLERREADNARIGCVIGTSKGGLSRVSDLFPAVRSKQSQPVSAPAAATFARMDSGCGDELPLEGSVADEAAAGDAFREFWSCISPNSAATTVARALGICGPVLCPVAACATGLVAVARAAELLQCGQCDAVVCGSADASLSPAILGSFQRLGVLARDFDDPRTAVRPFDARRSGFLVGEGAAVFVMETADAARQRGRRPYACWLSGGTAADPSGMTAVDPDAHSLTRLLNDVLARAELRPDDVDALSLHGTATHANDVCETRAVRNVFGSAADRLACFSLKGAVGHLLGAAGSVELAAAVLALRDQIVPPTVNLDRPDPDCDLNYTPRHAVRRPLRCIGKLSLGFGGHLAAAVLAASPAEN